MYRCLQKTGTPPSSHLISRAFRRFSTKYQKRQNRIESLNRDLVSEGLKNALTSRLVLQDTLAILKGHEDSLETKIKASIKQDITEEKVIHKKSDENSLNIEIDTQIPATYHTASSLFLSQSSQQFPQRGKPYPIKAPKKPDLTHTQETVEIATTQQNTPQQKQLNPSDSTNSLSSTKPTNSTNPSTFKALPLTNPKSVNIVFYHANCNDGAAAAAAAYLLLGNRAQYIPLQPRGTIALPTIRHKNVVVLDVSFSASRTFDALANCKSFRVIDHHVSAMKELSSIPADYKTFDMKRSGATLAWSFFHPDKPIPKILEIIEARDLWRYDLLSDPREAQTIAASFLAYEPSIKYFVSLYKQEAQHGPAFVTNKLLTLGSIVESVVLEHCQKMAARAVMTRIKPWNIPAVVVKSNSLRSDIANYLLSTFPEAKICAVFNTTSLNEGMRHSISLRARNGNLEKDEKLQESLLDEIDASDTIAPIEFSTEQEMSNELQSRTGQNSEKPKTTSNHPATSVYKWIDGAEVVDTTVISSYYGGGGHMSASHFFTEQALHEIFDVPPESFQLEFPKIPSVIEVVRQKLSLQSEQLSQTQLESSNDESL